MAAGVALAVVGMGVGLVKSLIDVERELRPAVERSRIAAESLQVLAEAAQRAGSEDGLEAIVDASQELQLQLGELALTGNARAVPALESLGLVAEKLQRMEPEAAFRAVVTELQKIPNVADRAIAAEEIFGGVSEKLAGIINLTAGEFANLEQEVRKTTDIWSQEALDGARGFDESLKALKASLTGLVTPLIAQLLPALSRFADWLTAQRPNIEAFFKQVKERVTPFAEAFKKGLVDVVFPAVKTLFNFIVDNKPILIAAIAAIGAIIVTSLGPVSGAILAITGIITAIGFLKDNTQIFKETWDRIWSAIKTAFRFVSEAILGFFRSKWAWLTPYGPLIKGLLFVYDNFTKIWNAIKSFFRGVADSIKGTVDRIIGTFQRVIDKAKKAVSAITSVTDVPGNVAGGIKDTVTGVAGRIGGFLGFADGVRNFRGGTALVGERGPELVNLPRGSSVIPNHAMGGTTINVYVQGNVLDGEDFYEKVNEARLEFHRRGN